MNTQKTSAFPAERLISVPYYAEQAGQSFADRHEAYLHFRQHGQQAGLNPSPFFYTRWYIWQNPDSAEFPTALDHFVWRCARGAVDPAPFIDAGAMLHENKAYQSMSDALAALTEGSDRSVSPLLEDHLALLAARQAAVHNDIQSRYIRRRPTGRRRLVWVQAGSRFSTTQWFKPDSQRQWDFMCNWYSQDGLDLRHGEIHLIQPGTKSTAIYHVLKNDAELFRAYDQLLFLDDDLTLAHEDIDRLFDVAEQDGLALFQAALLPGSHGVWKDLVRQSARGSRLVTGVEIMMPGFTRETLFSCAELFGRSVSGYGLDFLFSEHIRQHGGLCGVVDAVAVRHEMCIDERNGAYYRLMRSLGIQHQLELYAIIHELKKFPQFATVLPD